MSIGLQPLPIGVQSFELLRRQGNLYVDKTVRLMQLVGDNMRVFLSRPRRFGKSLTLSTLDAMFRGKAELFRGLAVEDWVAEQAKHPCPVLRLDMSTMDVRDVPHFERNLVQTLAWRAEEEGFQLSSDMPGMALQELVRALYRTGGPVVVLIDEYDKPILDNIGNVEMAEGFRKYLRDPYLNLKDYDEIL